MKTAPILFLLLSFFSSLIAAEELVNLSAAQLMSMQTNDNALVIDIRTPKEWESTGIISGSHPLQFFSSTGKYNTRKWLTDLDQLTTSPDQPIILVCRSGGRSGKLGHLLAKQLKMKNIHHLSSGISAWIKAGHKVVKSCHDKLTCK